MIKVAISYLVRLFIIIAIEMAVFLIAGELFKQDTTVWEKY